MSPSELKQHVEQSGQEQYFFDRKTMKFFGDTMRNYGVRSATVKTDRDANSKYTAHGGLEIECWELYRKRPVKHGNQQSAYFDKETFKRVHPAKD